MLLLAVHLWWSLWDLPAWPDRGFFDTGIDPALRKEPWLGPGNAIRLAALGTVPPLARSPSRRVHAAALLACGSLFVAFVVLDGLG